MVTLSEVMASLSPEQREAVETRFEALKLELAHATGAAIIANDRPHDDYNEQMAAELAALRTELAEYKRCETQWMEWNSGLRARVAELAGLLDEASSYVHCFSMLTKHPTAPADAQELRGRMLAAVNAVRGVPSAGASNTGVSK